MWRFGYLALLVFTAQGALGNDRLRTELLTFDALT